MYAWHSLEGSTTVRPDSLVHLLKTTPFREGRLALNGFTGNTAVQFGFYTMGCHRLGLSAHPCIAAWSVGGVYTSSVQLLHESAGPPLSYVEAYRR